MLMNYKINEANIKEWAANYEGPQFDGILCDPPYELGFMGKSWDSTGIAFDKDMWADLFRHVKPGGHLLAFSGSRTYHRMAVAIEDAGFEIRDMIEWVYGSGFPKSLNIGKAVDKLNGRNLEIYQEIGRHIKEKREKAGYTLKQMNKMFGYVAGCNWWESQNDNNTRLINLNDWNRLIDLINVNEKYTEVIERIEREREVVGEKKVMGKDDDLIYGKYKGGIVDITKGTSPYEGYGTALKPAHEPCVLARKPLEKGMTVAQTALKHGTGGLNIDGSRVGMSQEDTEMLEAKSSKEFTGVKPFGNTDIKGSALKPHTQGRFPANIIHDGSDEVVGLFPDTKSGKHKDARTSRNPASFNASTGAGIAPDSYGDNGSAARFFYTAKASKRERNAGLEESNTHPTLKPLSLTKYLANLIKPPTGGRLLVPFSGSGSEMIGALQAGWEYVEGVELTAEYIPIAEARIKHWTSIEEQTELL